MAAADTMHFPVNPVEAVKVDAAPVGSARFYLLVAVLSGISIVPFFVGAHVTTQDGPIHVYYGHVLSGYLAGENNYSTYYELSKELPPYLLTHGLFAGLGQLLSPINAERLLVSLYVLLFNLGLVYLVSSVDPANRFICFIGFCYASNLLLFLGFYNYCLAVVVFIFLLALWLRNKNHLEGRHFLVLGLGLVILYLCHPIVLGTLLVILFIDNLVLVITALKNRSFTLASIKALWRSQTGLFISVLPCVGLLLFYAVRNGSEMGDFSPAIGRIRWLLRLDYFTPFALDYYPLLIVTLMVGFLSIFWLVKIAWTKKIELHKSGILFSAFALFVIMNLVPKSINNAGYVPYRFPLLIMICLLAWLAHFRFGTLARQAITTVAVCGLISVTAINFYGVNQLGNVSEDEESLASVIRPNSVIRLGSTESFAKYPAGGAKFASLMTGGFYHAVDSNSVVILLDTEFQTAHFPIYLKPEFSLRDRKAASLFENKFDPREYYRTTGVSIDYFVIYDDPNDPDSEVAASLEPDYELVRVSRPSGFIKVYGLKTPMTLRDQ